MSEVGRTSAGLSSLAANGAHSQGPRPRADEIGHGPLHFYKPPSLPERLESRAGSRQMSRALSGRR
jgi:hypothetical protein